MKASRSIVVLALLCLTILSSAIAYSLPQPTSCITSSFSSSGGSNWKTIVLTLTNACGKTVDFQNSIIKFKTTIALNTSFWGFFSPLAYPVNSLQITSQGASGNYLASLGLQFPQETWANSKLPANRSIQIIYGAAIDAHVGLADVYLSDGNVVQTGNIQLTNSNAKPADVSQTYAVVHITANGNNIANVQLPWSSTQTVSGLPAGNYNIAADNISGSNNTYQGIASPSTVAVVANQTVSSSIAYTAVPQNGQLMIQLQTLPNELSGYAGKPVVLVIPSDSSSAVATTLNWGTSTTISQLKSGIAYSFSTPAITYNTYTCQPKFSPSTLVANSTTAPSASLTYLCGTQTDTPVSQNGQLSVCGNGLCNEHGSRIQLKGMSSHGIQWYGWQDGPTEIPCLTTASLDMLTKTWKASVIRISMYVQEGGYETNPTGYTNQVNALIDEATKRGVYAIVDWHILTPGDPNVNLAKAKTFFTAIANAHKNNNNLFYEIANEPNGVSWSAIKTYAEALIPVIRAIDNKTVILVGTPGWSSLGVSDGRSSQDIINAPLNFPNIMYTFHFYAASHRDEYLNEVDYASNTLPIFATEFGSQTYSGDGANDFVMTDRYLQLFATKKISWTNWNYSDDPLSGAVWKTGACSNGPWTDSNLKPSGAYIKGKIMN